MQFTHNQLHKKFVIVQVEGESQKVYAPWYKKFFLSTSSWEKEAFNEVVFAAGKEYMLRLLALREWFQEELKAKLKERYISENTISLLIEWAASRGYINEELLEEAYIKRLLAKGKGPLYIAKKLAGKVNQPPYAIVNRLKQEKYQQAIEEAKEVCIQKSKKEPKEALWKQGFLYDA